MLTDINKILILKWGAFGDIIASTPAINSILKHYSKARIDIVSDYRFVELFPFGETFYNHFYDIKQNKLSLIKKIRKEKYDLVINLKWTSEGAAIISYLSGAKYRLGSGPLKYRLFYNIKSPYHTGRYHEVLRNLDIVKGICSNDEKVEFIYYIDSGSEQLAVNFIKNNNLENRFILGVHPGASKPSKRWNIDRFKNVINKILSIYDISIILLYGKNEKQEIQNIFKEINDKNVILGPYTNNIRELAALVKKCNLFFCNNSGPMNLAVSLGVPTVAILGSSHIDDWGPYGNKNVAIKSPLYLHSFNEEDEKIAMNAIRTETVFKILSEKIKTLYE
ncbi:MAG TPA: glycosyltransferase family 9 protein [Ignavibacteria bacterium]